MELELEKENARPSCDWILGLVLGLLGLGIVVVYSAAGGRTTDMTAANRTLIAHCAHVFVGLIVFLVASRVDYHTHAKFAKYIWVVGIVLLVVVLFCPPIKGSHRWLVLGPRIRFQPSELMKLAMVLLLAQYLSEHRDEVRTFKKGFMYPTLCVGVACGLIFVEKDLGTSVLIGMVAFLVMIVAGVRPMFVAMLACVALPLVFEKVRHSPYQWIRITTFLNPYKDPEGAGYHAIQSLISLGSGGWLGLGLGCGKHKLLFVPETRADSVFCVVGEELGFVGAALVVAAYMMIVREGIRVMLRAPDVFGSLLAFGITMMIGAQAATNIAVVTVSVPTKGLPLPLLSAGGSSMLLTLASLGLLVNIAKQGVDPPTDSVQMPEPVPQPAVVPQAALVS